MGYKELFKKYFEMGHSRREAQRKANDHLKEQNRIANMSQRELMRYCIAKPFCT